ncbi:hypothetical protein EDB81DRAFT_374367 [Dactylonectria macrodidyma]|uniref:Uncharacterized protein n=1 Tax=Dactylonectria macrodidyma TaxID=307937 RepID=A0A9P9D013_9HYPO|nr:hypothetical protein EDB81DRAFT_374367 [Dactylonectria macrodidyma]
MVGLSYVHRPSPQARLVISFCPDDTLRALQSNHRHTNAEPVALLDDRANDGLVGLARSCLGPLTLHQLYMELLKKRFSVTETQPQSNHCTATESGGGNPRNALNADRRLM